MKDDDKITWLDILGVIIIVATVILLLVGFITANDEFVEMMHNAPQFMMPMMIFR